MTIVVGVAPGHCSQAAVHLGVLLARTYERELVVVSVNAAAWPLFTTGRGTDGEYQRFLVAQAEAALDEARVMMPADVRARYLVREASSARRGLLEVCAEESAMRLVLGSAGDSADGIELGSVSGGLLQSSEVPVAIAPHDFSIADGARLTRITAAYSGSDASGELVRGAEAVAGVARADFRVVSFHTRPKSIVEAGVGFHAEDDVSRVWEDSVKAHAEQILHGGISAQPDAPQPRSVEVAVGAGNGWHEALRAIDWRRDEVMLLGSSSLGLLGRISLGSHAAKILRHAPVPVVLVPRRAAEEYAVNAEI